MGVELNLNKTHITSSLDGFDFLGFNCRHYQVGSKLKTIIKPSSIKNVKEKIRVLIKTHKGVSQKTLIKKLNPVLRGWSNYFKHVVSKEIFGSIDNYVYERLANWAYKKHVNKGKTWIKKKYFHSDGSWNWVFRSGKQRLVSLKEIKIQRHVKIKGNHHVYDGDINYWKFRNKKTHIRDKSSIFSKLYVKQML